MSEHLVKAIFNLIKKTTESTLLTCLDRGALILYLTRAKTQNENEFLETLDFFLALVNPEEMFRMDSLQMLNLLNQLCNGPSKMFCQQMMSEWISELEVNQEECLLQQSKRLQAEKDVLVDKSWRENKVNIASEELWLEEFHFYKGLLMDETMEPQRAELITKNANKILKLEKCGASYFQFKSLSTEELWVSLLCKESFKTFDELLKIDKPFTLSIFANAFDVRGGSVTLQKLFALNQSFRQELFEYHRDLHVLLRKDKDGRRSLASLLALPPHISSIITRYAGDILKSSTFKSISALVVSWKNLAVEEIEGSFNKSEDIYSIAFRRN